MALIGKVYPVATKKLIPDSIRSNEAFRRDLGALLSLEPGQLEVINRMAVESADGFSPSPQASPVAEATGLSVDDARRAILVADVLYERCRDQRIPVSDAVDQLATIAPEVGVQDFSEIAATLLELLSPKHVYETEGYAKVQSKSVVAHFIGLDGVWDIRPVFHRETGKITKNLPVLLLNVAWHDDVGTSHSAAFQLDDDAWADLRETVQELTDRLASLDEYLKPL